MMNLLEGMLQKDKDHFVRTYNKLLSVCFLCRDNVTSRFDYYFVLKHKQEMTEYLSVLGYRLEINEDYEVIQLPNPQNYNRYNMKLYESIILLILRVLFDEKKRELSAADEVIVNVGEIEESRILIFDSILMTVRVEDIKQVYDKLEIYRKGAKTDEDTEEGETD